MSINFHENACQTLIKEKYFGLYDSEDRTPVKVVNFDSDLSNARVINERELEIRLTAIDNCIVINRENGEMDNRCDAMICYESNLLFIELKNKRGSWQSEGLNQIENTVKRMIEDDSKFFYGFKKRKAIVANRKYQFPSFHESNKEQREYFNLKYNIRLQFEADIFIK